VGADGIARSSSPPFPGLSNRGQVLIAKAAQPVATLRLDTDYARALTVAFIPAIGIAAVGGLAGALTAVGLLGLYANTMILPVLYQVVDMEIWRQYAANKPDKVDLSISIPDNAPLVQTEVQLPPPPADPASNEPLIRAIDAAVDPQGELILTIRGQHFIDLDTPGYGGQVKGDDIHESRVVFQMSDRRVIVDGSQYLAASNETLPGTDSTIQLKVPKEVLLGLSDIIVERPAIEVTGGPSGPTVGTKYRSSLPASIDNRGGFAFMGQSGDAFTGVEVIDVRRAGETGPEQVVKHIALPGVNAVYQTLASPDLSQVFVATDAGIAVIDAFTLQLFDVDPKTAALDFISIPGDGHITALALDPKGRFLYAAGTAMVHVIDLNPGSPTYHQVVDSIGGLDAPTEGLITSVAVNADGTLLFVAAPATTRDGGEHSWKNFGNDHGKILVINVNPSDRPPKGAVSPNKWHQLIGQLDGGIEPFAIRATSDPDRLLFVSRLDDSNGLHTIQVTDRNPRSFAAKVNTISLQRNAAPIGVRIGPYGLIAGTYGQVFDLNIRNASDVAVTDDLQYAFVGDFSIPTNERLAEWLAQQIEIRHKLGSKIGVVKDPFGDHPTLLASSFPIPHGFLKDVEIDSSGTKLYANYSGAGNIVVFDVDALILQAGSKLNDWSRLPLDHPQAGGVDIHGGFQAIDVE